MLQVYFDFCREVLLEPARYFREQLRARTLGEILFMGLLSIWLSSIVIFVWDTLGQLVIMNHLPPIFMERGIIMGFDPQSFITRAGIVLFQPVISLLALSLAATILFGITKIFVSHGEEFRYQDSLKILASAAITSWLGLLPFLGGVLAYFGSLIITIIGIREHCLISGKRATFIVLLPHLFIVGLVLSLLMVAGLALFFIPWDLVLGS